MMLFSATLTSSAYRNDRIAEIKAVFDVEVRGTRGGYFRLNVQFCFQSGHSSENDRQVSMEFDVQILS